MRLLPHFTLLLTLAASVPALSQSAPPAQTNSTQPLTDLSSFRDSIAERNRKLADQVAAEKHVVRNNTVILQDAKKIDAANKKLLAQSKQLEAQNAQFDKARQEMQAEDTETGPPPARVQPQPIAPAANSVNVAPPAVATAVSPVAPNKELQRRNYAAATTPPAPEPAVAHISTPAPAPTPKTLVASTPAPSPAPVPSPKAVAASAPAPVPVAAPAPDTLVHSTSNLTVQPPSRTVADVAFPSLAPAAKVARAVPAQPLRITTGAFEDMLLTPIQPVYPQIARSMHAEGTVIVEALVSREGVIKNVHAVSGPYVLQGAAIDAIKAAKPRPYRVDGETVEVQASVSITFQQTH